MAFEALSFSSPKIADKSSSPKSPPRAPPKGFCKKGMVILGLDKTPFDSDARIAFAKAISPAEASPTGEFKLLRFRGGDTETIAIKLETLPPFSPTAPFDCEKSATILKHGCDALADSALGRPSVENHINALALLATGDRSYRKTLQDHVKKTLANPLGPNIGLACWHYSFANIFLCEYYLLTKDRECPHSPHRPVNLLEFTHKTQHLKT